MTVVLKLVDSQLVVASVEGLAVAQALVARDVATTQAGIATTKAAEAATSATAAASARDAAIAEKLAAEAAKDDAETARDVTIAEKLAAEAAKDDAVAAAATSTTQAGIATTKAGEAATDAVQTAADRVQTGLDAATATTKASEAADSADAADIIVADITTRLSSPFSVVSSTLFGYSNYIVSDNDYVLAKIESSTGKWALALSDLVPFPDGWRLSVLGGVTFAPAPATSGYLSHFSDDVGNLLAGWKLDGTFKVALSADSLIPTSAVSGPVQEVLDAAVPAMVDDAISLALSSAALANSGVSGPDISCIGDSLTFNASVGPTEMYPARLATLTGRTVHNLGVGGEHARTIGGRIGGWPYMVSVAGGSIPASGGVTVTLLSLDGQSVAPLLQGASGLNPCFLAGVQGTLSLASGVYTFTRAAAGSAVTVKHPIALVTDARSNRMNDVLILDIGQNGGYADNAQLIAIHDAIFDCQTRAVCRGLVLGRTSGTLASNAALHDAMQRRYGSRFVNTLAYLSSYAALERAGITPTTDDDSAIAAGSLPKSFWAYAADPIHMNAAGYNQKAQIVFERLNEKGWM
jgi:hypothetical protein